MKKRLLSRLITILNSMEISLLKRLKKIHDREIEKAIKERKKNAPAFEH